MKSRQKKYVKKIKVKTVTFYLHENKLYEYSSKFNFQRHVKDLLKKEMEDEEH